MASAIQLVLASLVLSRLVHYLADEPALLVDNIAEGTLSVSPGSAGPRQGQAI